MKDVLNRLLNIRETMEKQAIAAANDCREQLEYYEDQQTTVTEQLERYREWMIKEEKQLFSNMQNKPIKIDDLLHYHGQLYDLTEEEENLKNNIQRLSQEVTNLNSELKRAVEKQTKAAKAKNKTEEMISEYTKQETKTKTLLEDEEYDEFGILQAFSKRQNAM